MASILKNSISMFITLKNSRQKRLSATNIVLLHGPVVQKAINANPRLKINQGRLFLYSQTLFNTDILQNFTLEETDPENKKQQNKLSPNS